MLPEGRDEMLTECARAWNKRKINSLVQYLCKRYYRAVEMSKHSLQKLDESVDDLSLGKAEIKYSDWKSEVQNVAKAEELISGRKTEMTAQEQYFLFSEHLRQMQLLENLECSLAPVVGAVLTYQNMYSSHIKKFKDVPAIEKRLKDLESDFEEFDRPSVIEEGKRLLVQRSLNVLQTKIEMVYFSIVKRTSAISKLADTSKQRAKLRRKTVADKEQMKNLVEQYSALYDGNKPIEFAAVLAGKFPWIQENKSVSDIPVRVKAMVVENYLISERWKEEIELVKTEMERFLAYYSKHVLPKLLDEITAISNLSENDNAMDIGDRSPKASNERSDITEDEEFVQYKVKNASHSYLCGLQALKKKGLEYCIKQLNMGVEHFSRITAGDYSKVQECFHGFPWSLSEGDSGMIEEDISDNDFDGNEEDDENDNDEYSGDEDGDNIRKGRLFVQSI
ncbi:uncharacterized protein LOC114518989 [Dendronephthya gigantea]|uniref:uncharacterized protein LOC114518989 n=1 Tax=Dendronephthya gigantea TaxID=151771 RepID=UPI00106DAFE1|nr:uncharacterized protein LOC114518989 [Dendronephthya gigantea]